MMYKTFWVVAVVCMSAMLLVGLSVSRGEKAGDDNGSSSTSKPTTSSDDLKDQAKAILGHRCSQCHNVGKLMASVDPKAGLNNKVYRMVSRGHNRKGKNGPCTADERKVIADWIKSLAKPDSQPASDPS